MANYSESMFCQDNYSNCSDCNSSNVQLNIEDTLQAFLESWESTVGIFIKAYVNFAGVILTFLNNFLVILIFIFGIQVKRQVTKQMRIYYIAIAIGDTSTVIPLQATYWAGNYIIFLIVYKE